MKKVVLYSLSLLALLFLQSSIDKKTKYVLFNPNQEKIQLQDLVDELQNYDLLFFGEQHSDSVAHVLELEILQKMHKTYGTRTVLSMEMFDREVQHIVDEYLAGDIKENYFNTDSRQWSNYQDYNPLVEYCKENRIPIICANAPFRYANLVSNKGYEALNQLSETSKKAMAPLPYDTASTAYRTKLENLLGEHAKNEKTGYDLIRGQSLWDATMAYSIFEYLAKKPDAKILHLNGKLHTEERLGIVEHLSKYNSAIKSLVITTVTEEFKSKALPVEENKGLGDYILYTQVD